ncbi:hypothetical protein PRUPE_3G252900 [Prunus persica]|uniref:Uncharacterized protein n=1 Tax=Prunus persica TaxID=3760 RepID=A0A251Q5C1_PRUPE|nr:hypothetical protein PRUPE_3G252900 [Prunus persica]
MPLVIGSVLLIMFVLATWHLIMTLEILLNSFFDLFWLRFPPFQRIFFYELPPSSAPTPLFFDSILPKLTASLSLTIQHFLPLAGSLTWPQTSHKPILNYVQGDAVSLTIAHDSDDHRADYFDHLSSCNEFVEAIKYHPLVPKLAMSHEKAAAMALQITLFPSRGFSIGTCMHHAILDGKSSNHGLTSLKPFYGKVITDPAGLESIYLNHFLNLDRPENRTLISNNNNNNINRFTFQRFLSRAYAWVCLAKSKAMEIRSEKIAMIFSIDCMSRLDPPLPASHFGNCIAGGRVVAETKGLLGENGLVLAVNAIREAIKGLDNKGQRIGYFILTSVAGSNRFQIYDTDFGWGKPRRTEVVSIDKTGAISLSDSKNGGGGVEIGLVLKKQYMDAFAALFAQGLL